MGLVVRISCLPIIVIPLQLLFQRTVLSGGQESVSDVGCQLFDVFASGHFLPHVRVECCIYWESRRSPKHHFEWCVSCGFVHACIVGKAHLWDSRFPVVIFCLLHRCPEHHCQSAIKSFHHAITLWVVGGYSYFFDTPGAYKVQ
ncbi:hypothetical protein T4D_13597 [Trichinella pseudospiralis]|uniref:Secreted protein n=1 Tax=Trichinella pseudospiralis TaxID=6337 RepID=A0A0V1G384_TRIPS|nr:hypothetical protein T4D_13597 [Trichinella pseudospiralis]